MTCIYVHAYVYMYLFYFNSLATTGGNNGGIYTFFSTTLFCSHAVLILSLVLGVRAGVVNPLITTLVIKENFNSLYETLNFRSKAESFIKYRY